MKNQEIATMIAEIGMLELDFDGGYHHTALFINRLKRIIELERGIRIAEANEITSLESSNESLRKLVTSLEKLLATKTREVFLLEQGLLRIPLAVGFKAKVEG